MHKSSDPPARRGYRMPAEWEPHEATWLSWPHPDGISFPGCYDKIVPVFVEMVAALADSEEVRINVGDAALERIARQALSKVSTAHVRFFRIPTNEPWCRDHGPIFVVRSCDPRLLILDWGYNAWGCKYPPYDLDDAVPTRIAEALNLPVDYPGIVLEGGSIDVNGSGSLLTTESCLLNPNRNPHLSREQIELFLRDYLGVSNILWLGDGIEGDDTDGHVDDITRFTGPRTVVTVSEDDPLDQNNHPLKANLSLLRSMKAEDGSPLDIHLMPMPSKIVRDGIRLPASYANFYIANKVVLLPIFKDPNDGWAMSILKTLFPDRQIKPIDARELVWGLGAFHCLTQQQPAVP